MTGEVLKIELCLYPQTPFGGEDMLEALLQLFESRANFAPEKWGASERTRTEYNRGEIVARIDTAPDSIGTAFLYRDKTVKYSAELGFGRVPFISMSVNKSMAPKHWPAFLDLCDGVAEVTRARFGVAHVFRSSPRPWITEQDRILRWISNCAWPVPVKFRPNGPLGLGMRTYFGGDILEMFGRDLLLRTPGIPREFGWGGIGIDLAQDLWNMEPSSLANAWVKAMEHLAPAQATAIPDFWPNGSTIEFKPSPAWENRIAQRR